MTTMHSIERAKERFGLNAKTAEHFIRNAIARGKTADDFRPGKERNWIEQRCSNGYTVAIYNGCCFILNDSGKCVTLYSLPDWFGKRHVYDGKERVRNAIKYSRFNYSFMKAS